MTGLERYGLLDGAGRPADALAVSLTGLDSMRLTTEELPRLAQHAGVAVEVTGQTPDYRDVGESLTIVCPPRRSPMIATGSTSA